MAMFPALMNDTMFSDLFDDPFFEGWRNMDRAAACDPNMSAGMMSTDVRETDKGYMNICSFQGHCYCRRRPIALFDDYCGSRPPLLRIKATGC